MVTPLSSIAVEAQSSNPNLFVSAENSFFENHFFGSMVVEVVIRDSNISDTDEGKGEPDVTLNGKTLRMVQASDGNWYAYFASKEKAQIADATQAAGSGEGLDFGAFCGNDTPASVFGISFSDTDGVAIPVDGGISGTTQGTASFNACGGGPPASSPNQNNVVRQPRSPNSNPTVPLGQIGIAAGAWPFIQLFSFNDNVSIIYNKGGGSQKVDLSYSDIPNTSLMLDRNGYPKGAEAFVTIRDMQLNQDPTSVDSWTFNINSPRTTFYQAFTEAGTNAANGGSGLVDLNPYLGSLGFEKNGNLGMNLGSVAVLKTNQRQPVSSVTTGMTSYTQIVTLVESEPNSGIFESFDFNDKSTIGISSNAPRGQSASIEYNSKSTSLVAGSSTASLLLGTQTGQLKPGQKVTITLIDGDQNLNQGAREDLDVFRSSAIIPTLQIGNPVTLEKASSVTFYPQSTSFVGGTSFSATVPDKNSDRLILAASASTNITFEKITLDLGITAGTLQSLLIDTPTQGTNWINYDLRSFEQQLGVTSFSDTKMVLYFGGLGLNPVSIIGGGEISSTKGFVQISNAATNDIKLRSPSSSIFLEIDFDASDNDVGVGTVSIEQDTQPIVFDLFSFGEKSGQRFNNAIYRAELEETSNNSGTFTGTIEYAVINQLNQVDPTFIKSLRIIDNEIKFLVNDKLTDEKGINLAYSDVANVGVTIGISSKTDITAHSGSVTLEKQTYRFGQPVVVLLTDPDLNTKHDIVDVYSVVDSQGSLADDTVGDTSGNILLEIRIKGFRYHRCTINGVEHGGLASTGFSLVETGPGTGVFKGSFKMPSQICSEDRTRLISPAGGSIEVSYFDFRDSSGQPREIGLTFQKLSSGPVLNIPKIEESAIIIKSTEIRDAFNRPVLQKSTVGQKLNFVTEISNNDQQSQSYSYIIQVRDQNNSIVDLRWVNGKVDPAKKNIATILWEPILPGNYTVEIFVWDGIDSATPLTKKTEYAINVGSR